MNGYNIKEELYESIGHRTIACTLILENGYEISGTYCLDMNELMNEDKWKEKAFKSAYSQYKSMMNAIDRQLLFTLALPIDRGEKIG